MKLQKHSIYQISVPFETVTIGDELILGRYIMLNCFPMDGLNYFSIEVEETYDNKTKPNPKQLIRVLNSMVFEERELKPSLHVMLHGLSNKEISGQTETIFLLTLFTEVLIQLDTEGKLDQFRIDFPNWNIDEFINEPSIPGKIAKLSKIQQEMSE